MSEIKVGDVVEMKVQSLYWNKGDKAKITQIEEYGYEGDFKWNKRAKIWGAGKTTWWFVADDCEKIEEKKRGIRIKAEKCFENGVKSVRILKINALGTDDLPREYLTGPHVYQYQDTLYLNETANICTAFIYEMGIYTSENFTKIMYFIKLCGIRLEEINKKKREKKKAEKPVEGPKKREWSGIKEYII